MSNTTKLLKNLEIFNQSELSSKTYQDSVKLLGTAQAQQMLQLYSQISQFTFLQKYQEVIQPLNHIVSEFNSRYNEIVKSNDEVKLTKMYTAVEKLSKVNYVFWKCIPMKLAEQLCISDDANITLEIYESQTNGIETKEIFDLCLKSNFLSQRKILLSQSFEAYLNGQYNLAIVGLFAIIDGILSEIVVDSAIRKTELKKRCEKLLNKLKNEKLSNDDYSILNFMKTFESAQNTFLASSDFSGDEPEYPNRHWIMHGKNTHINTNLDYIKLLRFLYGIILIDNLSRIEKS